jgi:hypothetical protein
MECHKDPAIYGHRSSVLLRMLPCLLVRYYVESWILQALSNDKYLRKQVKWLFWLRIFSVVEWTIVQLENSDNYSKPLTPWTLSWIQRLFNNMYNIERISEWERSDGESRQRLTLPLALSHFRQQHQLYLKVLKNVEHSSVEIKCRWYGDIKWWRMRHSTCVWGTYVTDRIN